MPKKYSYRISKVIVFSALAVLGATLPASALVIPEVLEQNPANRVSASVADNSQSAFPQKSAKPPAFVPGQIIVKLKNGKTPADLSLLNKKYKVSSSEKVFKDAPRPEDSLKALKNKLRNIGQEHLSWYWQVDKDSREYQDYLQRLSKEKEELASAIKAEENLIARLAERQRRAPRGAQSPDLNNIYLLRMEPGIDIGKMAEDYRANPDVEYAQPNYITKAQNRLFKERELNHPSGQVPWKAGGWGQDYADMWGLKKIQADKAWLETQGEGQIVAVIDSGVDYTHEGLAGNIWVNEREIPGNDRDDDGNGYVDDVQGWNFPENNSEVMDKFGHGTHVAGTIAALGNNNFDIVGVAPKAKIMPIKALDDTGSGTLTDAAQAFKYAADNGADVINNSWGAIGADPAFFQDAVDYAYTRGCVIIAAAGNDAIDVGCVIPAALSNVISVLSLDHNDQLSDFSNWGRRSDISAPGGESGFYNLDQQGQLVFDTSKASILSLRAKGTNMAKDERFQDIDPFWLRLLYPQSEGDNAKYSRALGTSMACPHVSGVAALILSVHSNDPDFSNDDVVGALKASADDLNANTWESEGWDWHSGFGRINARKAVSQERQPLFMVEQIWDPQYRYFHIVREINGNQDDFFSPGEAVEVATTVKNLWMPASNVRLKVSSLNPRLHISGGDFDLGEMGRGESLPLTFQIQADDDAEALSEIRLNFHLTYAGGSYKQQEFIGYVIPQVNNPLSLKSVFPTGINTWALNAPLISDAPLILDLDKDGVKKIIVAGGTKINAYQLDGKLIFSYDAGIPLGGELSAGDVNGDGYPEIAAISRWSDENIEVKVFLIDHTGRPVNNNWPKSLGLCKNIKGRSFPVFADMDDDGKEEIIVNYAIMDDLNDKATWYTDIHVWKEDGAEARGWPKRLSSLNCRFVSQPALGDLDGDGKLELVAAAENAGLDNEQKAFFARLYAWRGNGEDLPGWLPGPFLGDIAGITCGDLDGDGKDEVVVYQWREGIHDGIAALTADGSLLAGWPKDLPYNCLTFGTNRIVLGDIDRDGSLEIAVPAWSDDYLNWGLFILKSNGTSQPGWPRYITPQCWGGYFTASKPLIADINNDGEMEAVLNSSTSVEAMAKGYYDAKLFAWDKSGNNLSGFPKETREWLMFTPSITDLDQDGKTDMVFIAAPNDSWKPDIETKIYVAQFPLLSLGQMEWGEDGNGPRRQNRHLRKYSLNLEAVNGRVVKEPDKIYYSPGESAQLTAVPEAGYSFGNWSGDASGSANPVTVIMNNSKSVTANFTQITYTLTITSPNGSITKSPDKASYSYNENVTLTAVPQAGYTFASWSGDASGATNPLNLVINGNTTVGANFTAVIPVEVIVTPEVRPPVITAPDNSSPSQSAPSAADSDNNTESANVDNAARVIIVYGNTTAPPPPQRSILPSLPSVTQAVAVSRAELNSASQPVPAAENREISPAGYTYNQNLGQDDGVYYTPTPNPKVIALSDNKLIMPDNNAREENFITKPKEPVFPPRVEAKRVGSFFGIWGKYKLELKNTSSIPVYWELAKNEKLPFGINLDYEQGIISGITLGKKEIKVTLAVTLENKDNINVTCLISM